ncbi:MAG TPA: alpha-E domain-containing protein, partial [Rhizomicrobium sp.]|nr:alpha-E domain-containing protein [Rhizomicrobium sp.]
MTFDTVIPASANQFGDRNFAAALQRLIYNPNAIDGLQQLLDRVRRTAWSARDRLSLDTWRTLHIFTDFEPVELAGRSFDPAQALTYLDALVRRAAALSGLAAENMTRGPNWLFADLGRRVERASHTAVLVRDLVAHSTGFEMDGLRIALEIADSAMTYRSRYLNVFQVALLVDLLLLDEYNPRGVAFQVAAMESHIGKLPRITPRQRSAAAVEIIAEAERLLASADSVMLSELDHNGTRAGLVAFVGEIDGALSRVSDAITDAYFQHATYHRTGAERREA